MMDEISLCIMTREHCHALYKDWENDPASYMDMNLFAPYKYDENKVDRYFDSKQNPNRVLFAILKDGKPIGELHLKQIDWQKKECTLSIHMQNDTVKGHGYGTEAERLAVQYAFDVLGMVAVNADTVIKNTRSQHVLEKVGFQFIREENGFKYYRCERNYQRIGKSGFVIHNMKKDKYTICDECGSEYLESSSQMVALCPECSHILYGYPNCNHIFKDGRCIHCHWDGSRSEYIKKLIGDD